MRKVEVLPELYLANLGLYYVISKHGIVYCATDGMTGYVRSGYTMVEFNTREYPVANVKMRWIHVDE